MNKWSSITPNFSYPDTMYPDRNLFISSIEHLIEQIIPPPTSLENLPLFYQNLERRLPLIHTSFSKTSLLFTALCQGEFGHGTGRFISDICSRWLVPGKQIPIAMARSSSFTFQEYNNTQFFIIELILHVDEEDLPNIKNHLERLIQDVRLSILSVELTRKIVSMKSLTQRQKKIVLEENLSSLFNRPLRCVPTIFDHAHHLVMKAMSEEKMEELHKEISLLLGVSPQTFDRDLFEEIHPFLFLLNDAFKSIREAKHLIRLVAYQHLFRKILQHTLDHHPSHQQVSLKIFRSFLGYEKLKQPILGLLIGLNLLNDHELLEEKHLFRAIQSIIPHAIKISHSYLNDRRSDPRLRIMYLEIKKQGRTPFSQLEISELRRRLPSELKHQIETVVHPLFIEYHEEEVMRNILTLSQELKAIGDIPQTMINFCRQNEHYFSFNVILLRVLKNHEKSLKGLIEASSIASEISNFSTKIVGGMKRKHQKEASIFEVLLHKKPFLRPDNSLDLNKGRQCVISTLNHLLGDVTDFNGGMTSKQDEFLSELKKLLKGKSPQSDFLIENFFYSLTPVYMQSLLPPPLLKNLFLMMLEGLEHNFTAEPLFSKTQFFNHTFMMMLGSPYPSLLEAIQTTLSQHKTLFSGMTSSKVNSYEIYTLGYILSYEEQSEAIELRNTILSAVMNWQDAYAQL